MIALWIYRRMLVFYPSALRSAYGAQMAEEFREEWAAARCAGWPATAVFWLHLVRDWAETVAGSHAEIAGQDLRAAVGGLKRRPLATGVLVMLFGCVICANTVMLLVAQRLMLKTLPFEARGRLVYLAKGGAIGGSGWQMVSRPLIDRLAQMTGALEDVAYITDFRDVLDELPVHCYYADPAAFRDLGLTAAAGRFYNKEDASLAVIGSHLWNQRYGGLSSAIGSNLKIAGREYQIAGILDDEAGPFDADVWLPPPAAVPYGGLIARLKRGAALSDAQAEWIAIEGAEGGRAPARLAWLRSANRDPKIDFIIWLCQAAFLAALLLACADLASFQFAYILRRRREIALRMAVGASRGRLLRFVLTESVVTAVLAGIVSLPLSAGLISFLHTRLDPVGVYRLWGWSYVRLDAFAILIAAALSVASGVVAGFLPAWRIVNRNPWPLLAPPPRRSRYSVSRLRLTLLAIQLALAASLVCFAVAFTLEGRGRLDNPTARYLQRAWEVSLAVPGRQNWPGLMRQVTERLEERGYPVIVTDALPFVTEPDSFEYEAGGRFVARIVHVNSRFFDVPGFRWLRGRVWSAAEEVRFPPPVVVNEAVVHQMQRLGSSLVVVNPNGTRVAARIAGVVDQPSLDPYGSKATPTIFVPYPAGSIKRTSMVVRFAGSSEVARAAIQTAIREVDPGVQPAFQDYGDRIRATAIAWRYLIGMLGVTSILALSLAVTGAAAYLTQTLSECGQEVALRCAFGSRWGGIWTWVTRCAAPAFIAGAAIAAICAAMGKRLPSGMAPANGLVLWGACIFAIVLVAGVWSAVCWLASCKSVAEPLMNRLRHV
jgi:putative ABC transport system permease protein